MAAKWKRNTYNPIAIDLGKKDIYGLDGDSFEAYYVDNDGNVVDIAPLNEAIKPIDDPASCKASGDTEKDNKDVAVDDASNFKVGMVVKIKDKEEYYYIEAIDTDNNILTFRSGLKTDLADGTEINQVGNTGIYGTKVKIDEAGSYFFVVNNPSIGLMNKSIKVQVMQHNEDDVYGRVDRVLNKLDDLEEKLDLSVDGTLLA